MYIAHVTVLNLFSFQKEVNGLVAATATYNHITTTPSRRGLLVIHYRGGSGVKQQVKFLPPGLEPQTQAPTHPHLQRGSSTKNLLASYPFLTQSSSSSPYQYGRIISSPKTNQVKISSYEGQFLHLDPQPQGFLSSKPRLATIPPRQSGIFLLGSLQ